MIVSRCSSCRISQQLGQGASPALAPVPINAIQRKPLLSVRKHEPEGVGNHGFFVQERGAHHHV